MAPRDDEILHTLRRIEKAVLGNGDIGLVRRVDRHGTYWKILIGAVPLVIAAVSVAVVLFR